VHTLSQILPVPGPVWGSYPTRADDDRAPPWRAPQLHSALSQCRRIATQAAAHAQAWRQLDGLQRQQALGALRLQLRRDGLRSDAVARALGAAAGCAAETLQLTPRPVQLIAAAALLDNRMAEMATGEGKTLAVGLAAAVAALAGLPVHVLTANSYLAARDAQRLAPLFQALGLRVAAIAPDSPEAARRAAYALPIVYATAKDVAFDQLRDHQAAAGRTPLQAAAARLAKRMGQAERAGPAGVEPPQPLLRGLCMALLDEADSILLDEAEVPLVLSHAVAHAARRAFLWQALSLARLLVAGVDFSVQAADRSATLLAAGEERLASLAQHLGGPWQRPRYRREALQVALVALHVLKRDLHYVVTADKIELLDPITGRIAAGRVWSRGLHTVVALKEGLAAPPETETLAQTTFQRFFRRYWRLGGISGTLWEARAELRAVYGTDVVRVPLHRPCLRRTLAARHFGSADVRWAAVAEQAATLQATGRPLLVGTDSVADSLLLSAQLQTRGIAHSVLNALNHAQEADIVAAAGCAGAVTVATRMAGRGTDIELDSAARAAGGLHVLCCQDNASARLDRQLAGRAARHGDPGSVAFWPLQSPSPSLLATGADKKASWKATLFTPRWAFGARALKAWKQRREERRRAVLRRQLLEHDLHWERRLSFSGRAA